MDNTGFTFIYVKICKVQITIKIYKCSDCIKQEVREGCANLGGKGCPGLYKMPIKLSRVKGKYKYKNYKNP